MKGLFLVACLVLPIAWALSDESMFMACQLQPLTGSPSGLVACIMGVTSTNNSLVCSFQYAGLAGDLQGADIRQYSGKTVSSTSLGLLVDFSDAVLGASDPNTGSFDAIILETTQYSLTPPQMTVTFPVGAYNSSYGDFRTVLAGCFAEDINCIVTLRTDTHPQGELACFLTELVFGADFEFPLETNQTLTPGSEASGYAFLTWFTTSADVAGSAQSVWAYEIQYDKLSDVVDTAGLFNAMNPFPQLTSMPATIAFDINGALKYNFRSGSFVGVAIQGTTGTGGPGNAAGYNVIGGYNNYQFLANCSQDLCYVGVASAASPGLPELRGQLIAGVAQLVPSLVVLMALMVALLF